MKYMRTAGYTWTDYKTNAQIAKELKITPILGKLLGYKRSCIQHVNRMPWNRLPSVMKHYSPKGRRNHGRPLKRILDTWDQNGSTSDPTPWQIYGDEVMMMHKTITPHPCKTAAVHKLYHTDCEARLNFVEVGDSWGVWRRNRLHNCSVWRRNLVNPQNNGCLRCAENTTRLIGPIFLPISYTHSKTILRTHVQLQETQFLFFSKTVHRPILQIILCTDWTLFLETESGAGDCGPCCL